MIKRKLIRQNKINSLSIQSNKSESFPYILIDKKVFHISDYIDFTIFYSDKKRNISVFLNERNTISLKHFHKLKTMDEILILKSDKEKYDIFLERNIQNIVDDNALSIDEKCDIIYESTTELTLSLYSNPEALKNAQSSKNIITPILGTILHNNSTISSYIKIIEYDYYTHTHSLNVSIYALCLGSAMRLSEEKLSLLGRAALLHDLGKSQVDVNIVNKKDKLTQDEFQEMKMHPNFGYEIALKMGIDDKDFLDGIHYHHEKLNGTGYPDSIKGEAISLFPRIIAVCDIFDALTSRRSYKEAMSSFDALILMKREMSNHLDMKILGIFIKMLH